MASSFTSMGNTPVPGYGIPNSRYRNGIPSQWRGDCKPRNASIVRNENGVTLVNTGMSTFPRTAAFTNGAYIAEENGIVLNCAKGHDDEDDDHETVTVNVGGTKHEILLSTLRRFPGTRLSRLALLLTKDESYRHEKDDYYFDRNAGVFACILEYYRTGELHFDQSFCGSIMSKELQFWQISEREMDVCCWAKFDEYRVTSQVLKELDYLFDEDLMEERPKNSSCCQSFRYYLWNTLEDPSFSIYAKMFVALSTVITLSSIFAFVAETHYIFQTIRFLNNTSIPAPIPAAELPKAPVVTVVCAQDTGPIHITNHTSDNIINATHDETNEEHDLHAGEAHLDSHVVLHYIDWVSFGYFLVELVVRFAAAPHKKKFLKRTFNIVELICIMAQSISIIQHIVEIDAEEDVEEIIKESASSSLLLLLESLRIMRVVRVFKLLRHQMAFKVLVYTIQVSFKELVLIVSFLLAGVLMSASIMHYAEEETFTSIPYAIWWALVTMTTVGYGDVVPHTPLGYLIGAVTVIAGVLVIAFTVPIVVNNFTQYYFHCKSRQARLAMMDQNQSLQSQKIKKRLSNSSKSSRSYTLSQDVAT